MRLTLCGSPLLALLLSACVHLQPPSIAAPVTPADNSLVITGVSLIDTEQGTVSEPQDILIDRGRIAAVAPAGALTVPAGIRQVDGSNRFALAGLIDVHAHVGEGGIGPQDDSSRDRALEQFLRYGVTTIFVPGATGAGDADFRRLVDRCRSATAACPGISGTGSIITVPGSHPVSTIFQMPANVSDAATEARGVTMLRPGMDVDALIAKKKAAGASAIKIIIEDGPPPWYPKPRLTDEQIASIVKAAHAKSLPVYAHISTSELTELALNAGVDGIMHAPTDRLPDEVIRGMAARGMWYVPTLALYDGILTWARKQRESDPYALKGVEPSAIASLAAPPFLAASHEDEAGALAYLRSATDNLRRASLAGVPIALGSDVNNPFVYPGYSAHEELAWMVKAGLTPAQALRAGTIGSAAFLKASNHLGQIAPGHEADLIILARNPLDAIENSRSIVAVISDGYLVPEPVSAD